LNSAKRIAAFILLFGLLAISIIALLVVYQSSITIEVIDVSLTRHVNQYLIEKPTQELITRELATLHSWLAVVSTLLLISASLIGWMVYSQRERFVQSTS
jgi:hypothetical protein